jgi:hypothetical protein
VADLASVWVHKYTPQAAQNMRIHSAQAEDCRIGLKSEKIFAAATCVADYTAHNHLDQYDVPNGVSAVLTFLRDPSLSIQYHCLPKYRLTPNSGPGVAIHLPDNSMLLEPAALETHSSTRVENPHSKAPGRVAFVIFTHECLKYPDHGSEKRKSMKESTFKVPI